MHIVLLGYMGSGKTTIGKKLAKKLEINFIDLDDYIEEQEGSSINKIFSDKGEIYFRKLEHRSLQKLLDKNDSFVLSIGGGTPCYANNIELINKSSFSIYLKTSIKDLYKRLVKRRSKRPLIKDLKKDDLYEFIAKHLFERAPYYEKAQLIISTDKKESEIIDEIKSNML